MLGFKMLTTTDCCRLEADYRSVNIALVMCVMVMLNGCATPTASESGPYPTAYRAIAKNYVRQTFFDPYSIRDAEISQPKPGQMAIPGIIKVETGWIVCVRANAKNRMGAYTGIRDTVMVIRDGQVLGSLSDQPTHYDIRTNCRDIKYEPFSEIQEGPGQR